MCIKHLNMHKHISKKYKNCQVMYFLVSHFAARQQQSSQIWMYPVYHECIMLPHYYYIKCESEYIINLEEVLCSNTQIHMYVCVYFMNNT